MHNVLHRATLHLVGAHPAVDAVALKMDIEEINIIVLYSGVRESLGIAQNGPKEKSK